MENRPEQLRGTRTEENLRTAFAGESQARNKYSYYADRAQQDGYNQIAEVFRITALNEEQHAKIWFKLLNDGIHATVENLKNAADGEHFEWAEMYEGCHCVGASILDHADLPIAAIWATGPSVSLPRGRFAAIGALVREHAARISARFGHGLGRAPATRGEGDR